MPWEPLKPRQQSAQIATLNKGGITLSSRFIESQKLMEYKWVEIFIDDTLRRIGFKFHNAQTTNTLKLSGKKGKAIYTRKLRDRRWIAEILDDPKSDKRFLIETDDSIEKPTEGVRYYISVGYRLQPKREFGKQGDYPRLPGVYRLFKDGQIVRIGESDNLERRLNEHFSIYEDEVDEYDFMEVPDLTARKREEKRLLEEFGDAYGRLPKLNSVAK